MTDKPNITIKINTRYDGSGLNQANDAVKSLGSASNEIDDLQTSITTTSAAVSEMSTEWVDAGNASADAGQKMKRGNEQASASAKNTIEQLSWLRQGWVKVSQAVSGLMGGIGLINQIVTVMMAAYDKINEKSDQYAQKQKEQAEHAAERYKDLAENAQNKNMEQSHADAIKRLLDPVKLITREYERQTSELAEQVRLRLRAIEVVQGYQDIESEIQRSDVNTQYYNGLLTPRQRDMALEKIEREKNERKRLAEQRQMDERVRATQEATAKADKAAAQTESELNRRTGMPVMSEAEYAEAIRRREEINQELARAWEDYTSLLDKYETEAMTPNERYETKEELNRLRETKENAPHLQKLEAERAKIQKSIDDTFNLMEREGFQQVNNLKLSLDDLQKAREAALKSWAETNKALKEKLDAQNEEANKQFATAYDTKGEQADMSTRHDIERQLDKASTREAVARREAEDREKSINNLKTEADQLRNELQQAANEASRAFADTRKILLDGLSGYTSNDPKQQQYINQIVDAARQATEGGKLDNEGLARLKPYLDTLQKHGDNPLAAGLAKQLNDLVETLGKASIKNENLDKITKDVEAALKDAATAKNDGAVIDALERVADIVRTTADQSKSIAARVAKLETAAGKARNPGAATSVKMAERETRDNIARQAGRQPDTRGIDQAAARSASAQNQTANQIGGLNTSLGRYFSADAAAHARTSSALNQAVQTVNAAITRIERMQQQNASPRNRR